jgi:seryl-tRNA synthetase
MRIALPPTERSSAVQETLRTQLRFHFPSITDVTFAHDGVDIDVAGEVPMPEVSATLLRLDDKLRDLPAVPMRVVYDSADAASRRPAGRHHAAAFDLAVRHLVADMSEAVEITSDAVATRPAGRGMNQYGTEATVVQRVLDSLLRRYFVRAYRAHDIRVPSMLPTRILDRAGYLETASQHLSFVSPLDPDPPTFNRFLPFWREHAKDGVVTGRGLHDFLAPPRDVLNPALCLHSFEPLAGCDVGAAPVVFTMAGSCFRDESGNLNHLERLREFKMREAVFVGGADELGRIHGELLDFMIEIARLLDLDFRLETATDIFFNDGAVDRLFSQMVSDNKLELAVRDAGAGRPVATASLNKHHDHFTPRFEISAGGAPARSMCIAFGLDRLALAVAHREAKEGTPMLASLLARATRFQELGASLHGGPDGGRGTARF